MKLIVSIVAFAMALTLGSQSIAAGGGDGHHSMGVAQPKQDPAKRITPDSVELVAPEYAAVIAGDKATVEWKGVEGADQYHVQVAKDPNFKWLVANEYFNKTTSYEVSGLEAGKTYFWRVAAVNSKNEQLFRKSSFKASSFAVK